MCLTAHMEKLVHMTAGVNEDGEGDGGGVAVVVGISGGDSTGAGLLSRPM